jgi:hypothetical protein
MNAQIDPDRVAIMRNAKAIRSTWSEEERIERAKTAQRYSRMLWQLVSEPEECDELWAVGAPADVDLGRLAVAS